MYGYLPNSDSEGALTSPASPYCGLDGSISALAQAPLGQRKEVAGGWDRPHALMGWVGAESPNLGSL